MRQRSSLPYMTKQFDYTDGTKLMQFSWISASFLIRYHTIPWQSSSITMASEKKNLSCFQKDAQSCPKDVKANCYKSIVLPQLEYASMNPTLSNWCLYRSMLPGFAAMTTAKPAVSLQCCTWLQLHFETGGTLGLFPYFCTLNV